MHLKTAGALSVIGMEVPQTTPTVLRETKLNAKWLFYF